ncbi:aldo/keto reductase [Sphingomonas sp. OK281]|uniref:aldo/keto reductase n=1 Tax=Sphingomonas sp. OK281 TaxID=1881067 RepID=UPI000B80DE95|nr:aldo/keto reductase [Sphingomonas sp. OK281]
MPVGADHGVGALVCRRLGGGRPARKFGRNRAIPKGSRPYDTKRFAPPVDREPSYRVIDALEEVAAETCSSARQAAIARLLGRATVASVVAGARNEARLREHLGTIGGGIVRGAGRRA